MNEPRIILTDDGGSIAAARSPQDIGRSVARYSGKGIDVVSYDFVGGDLCAYRSKVIEIYSAGPFKEFADAGVDVPAVVADECHRRGLQYWAAIRMNTQRRHTKFKEDNPDCVLTATSFARPGLLNYESPKVREMMLMTMRELVEDYEADGLLLDFTRYCFLFHHDRWLECTPILTDYLAQVRRMLDEVGTNKGRHIPLATKVNARVSDCLRYSMDVKTWAQQGIVQYLLPSRWNNTDFNLPVEQFVGAAQGTQCRVFPVLHVSTRHLLGRVETRMTEDMFRAAAHLYYRSGAHGLATTNIGVFPENLFHELSNPDLVAQLPHHYRYSLQNYDTSDASMHFSVEPADEEAKVPSARRQIPFRVADDPASRRGGLLRFPVANLHPKDVLEIDLNGAPLPRTVEMPDGSFEHPRWPYEKQPTSELHDYLYEFSLHGLPLIQGENFLGFQILSSPPGFGLGMRVTPVIRDLEVIFP